MQTLLIIAIGLVFILAMFFVLAKPAEKYESNTVYYDEDAAYSKARMLNLPPIGERNWRPPFPQPYYVPTPDYYTRTTAYDNDDLLKLPPVHPTYPIPDTLDESLAPKESGITLRRSAYKANFDPKPFKGSYGVGYTDERAAY